MMSQQHMVRADGNRHAIFDRFYYGGDWNPEQWDEEVWAKDLHMLADAGINEATINVFAWAQLQPDEHIYDFTVLDKIVDLLASHNFGIVMGTSTAAIPSWMAKRYPDVMRTDFEGRRHVFGDRHNPCPNSPTFRRFAPELARRLAQRYGGHPSLVAWHVSNEYGEYCYCDTCLEQWKTWLQVKYGSLDALNDAWNGHFWQHLFLDWDDIVVPNALGPEISPGVTVLSKMSMDYRRFMSDSIIRCFTDEKRAIRQYDERTPITTNMMGLFMDIDYFDMGRFVDVVSWDNYPRYDSKPSRAAMCNDLYRAVGRGKPFMLMEQTPSQQNWQPYNTQKRPGQMRAMSYQSIAHGADTIQFFQLRQSVSGCERFHGAVISHADTENTRVFREVQQLGKELHDHGDMFRGGTCPAQVALMFDWDSYWSMYYSSGPSRLLEYTDQVHRWYEALWQNNVQMDIVRSDASVEELSRYRMVVAPALCIAKNGMSETVDRYVQSGGCFVTTTMSGIADENDKIILGGYPGAFRGTCGAWGEEIDALLPDVTVGLASCEGAMRANIGAGSIIAEVIRPTSAQVWATYADQYYAGAAAVTCNHVGSGHCIYVGTVLDEKAFAWLLGKLNGIAKFDMIDTPENVEVRVRNHDDKRLMFIINHNNVAVEVDNVVVAGDVSVLSGTALSGTLALEPYGIEVIARDR